MPRRTYMAVDPRLDHSLRVPRPDVAAELGTPNACASCHLAESGLRTERTSEFKEYADWLHAAHEGDQEVREALARVGKRTAEKFRSWYGEKADAALHYAHLYWRPKAAADGKPGRHGGLEFPGGTKPGAWDFLYFSFVIGMTAQTSDTAITTTGMRRFNLLHGIVSFFFNTVLVAVAVNVAVALAGLGASSP